MITRIHRTLVLLSTALLLVAASCGNLDESRTDRDARTQADSSRIDTLGAASIEKFLATGGPAIIEFGGKRCLPCMEMRDILEQVGKARPDVRLGVVFWEDDPELFEKWKVPLIPAQIVFDGTREVQRHRGTWERDRLLTELARRFPESNTGE